MNNQDYIYENHGDETLNNILFEIKKHILKEDIFSPYMEKETFLYNHPSLNKMSEYAIKTDTFNFINADYFNQLSTLSNECGIKLKKMGDLDADLHQETLNRLEGECYLGDEYDEALEKMEKYENEIKQLINSLPNINFFHNLVNNDNLNSLNGFYIEKPIVNISDENFFEILKANKIQSYKTLKEEIYNKNNDEFDSVKSFTQKDKNFLINFKQETLPNFINIFNKIIQSNEKEEALHFSEFFSASVGHEASKLSDLGFSIFAHSLFSYDFEPYFSEPMIHTIFRSKHITESKRLILIDEGSQLSKDLLGTISSLTITEQPFKRKNYGI